MPQTLGTFDPFMREEDMDIGIQFYHSNYEVEVENEIINEEEECENLGLYEALQKVLKKNDPKKDKDDKKEEPKYVQTDNGKTIKLLLENFECFKQLADPYSDWFKYMCAIYNSVEDKKEGYDLIHQFSKLSNKYDEDEVDKKYEQIINKQTSDNKKMTIASMIKVAKKEDLKKYETLFPPKKTKTKKVISLDNSIKNSTEYAIAKVFVNRFGNNFKMVDIPSKKCYMFDKETGRWKLDNGCSGMRNMISNELKALYDTELSAKFEKLQSSSDDNEKEILSKEIKELGNLITKLEKTTDKNNIVKEIGDMILDVEFEKKLNSNVNLFAFTNCVMDLNSMTTRPAKFDDYISWTCGYDYKEEIDPTKLKDLTDLLKKILPDPKVLQLVLEILSCGFTGQAIEKFVVFNGGGGNGKGLLDEFVKLVFGEYCYIYAPVCLLTEKDKTGPNPEKVKLHNKRICIMKEPTENTKLKNDRVKEITGGGNISGRDLYAGKNDCEITLALLLIMECNKRPLFEEDPTDAEARRIIDVLFPNKFTDKKELINNTTIFQSDVKYKTMEWKLEHRDAFVYLLFKAFKDLKKNNYELNIPDSVKERSQKYINESFTILKMFKDYYEPNDEPKDFIKISDVYSLISTCPSYINLTKAEKRKYNKTYFVDFFASHSDFNGIYYERKAINGKAERNILWKYKIKEDI
jgi:phage/plasmid-associated DNA primase